MLNKISFEITEINYVLKYIQSSYFKYYKQNISHYYCFCCILDQMNAGLMSRRDFFKKLGSVFFLHRSDR